MANAWILRPLPITSAAATGTSIGDPAYIGNDYAGVVWQSTGASPSLTIDLGADVAVDTVAFFGLTGGFAAAATVRVALATAAQGGTFGLNPPSCA